VVAWSTYKKPEKKGKDKDDAKDAEPKADKNALVEFLKKTYRIDEDDLLSAELEIVPAGMPREVGFDRALIAGYGHDDRVCSFAGLQALIDASDAVPDQTASILMCDKEEIGSMGSTGMQSSFFENTVAELIERQEKNAKDIHVRRALERSSMLSADVTAATSTRPATRRASTRARRRRSTRAARASRAPATAAPSSWRKSAASWTRAA